jgi:hypothetical protein
MAARVPSAKQRPVDKWKLFTNDVTDDDLQIFGRKLLTCPFDELESESLINWANATFPLNAGTWLLFKVKCKEASTAFVTLNGSEVLTVQVPQFAPPVQGPLRSVPNAHPHVYSFYRVYYG